MMPRAVFLDRDGVLNEAHVRDGKPYPPASVEDLVIPAAVPDALLRLRRAGYRLVVVTNQPDVARGAQRREVVEAINAALARALPIDEIRVCYHDDGDRCGCRKPAPGLLTQDPEHDLARSVMIGDRWRDVGAGRRAGVGRVVFIDRGYAEPCRDIADARVSTLSAAVDWILEGDLRSRAFGVKIFADGASLEEMRAWARTTLVQGFTTNPTLMRRAGVRDYARFARDTIAAIPDRPVSFEVLSDEFADMEAQAREIAAWAPNAVVKIPITNTRGDSAARLIRRLSRDGVRVNVTAILTTAQVRTAVDALAGGAASNVSIFAGRIADTGRDPAPVVAQALAIAAAAPSIEVIWASPREVWNVYQADALGCHIITLTTDLLAKIALRGKDLEEFSLETVRTFYTDAVQAGLVLKGHAHLT